MARRGSSESGGMAAPLIGVAISLLIFVIIEIFAPTIAGTLEESRVEGAYGTEFCNIADGGGSDDSTGECGVVAGQNITTWAEWNTTHHTDIPSGASTWTTVIQIAGAVFLVIVVTIAFFYLKGMS